MNDFPRALETGCSAAHGLLKVRWLCCLLLLALPLQGVAEEKKKKRKRDRKRPPVSFQVPIPIGHQNKGIKLPNHDEQGRLQMNFEIGTATRVDEENLEMTELKIEIYDEAGKAEMIIEMEKSNLDLNTRVLSSVDPVTIHRHDMELTGKEMTFDTKSRQGKFTGPVKMLIFNRDDFQLPKEEKSE